MGAGAQRDNYSHCSCVRCKLVPLQTSANGKLVPLVPLVAGTANNPLQCTATLGRRPSEPIRGSRAHASGDICVTLRDTFDRRDPSVTLFHSIPQGKGKPMIIVTNVRRGYCQE